MTAMVDQEARLARYRNYCGCKSSAFMLTVAMIGYPIILLLGPSGLDRGGWARLWWGMAVVLAAGLMGKVGGLATGALLYRWTKRAMANPVR